MKRVIALLLLMTSLCFAQNLYWNWESLITAPTLGSTRSFAMGGVFSATNQGVEGLVGNPAGMTTANDMQLIASGRMRLLGVEVMSSDFNDEEYAGIYKPGIKFVNLGVVLPIEVIPAPVKLVSAIGFRNYYDTSINSEIKNIDDSYAQEFAENQKGTLNVLSLGLGAQIHEQVSLGVVMNIPVNTKYEDSQKYYYDNQCRREENDSFDINGSNFLHMGVTFQATPQFKLGATYTLGHLLETKANANSKIYNDMEIDIPAYWSVGANYQFAPILLVAVELQNRPWEDVKINGEKVENSWNSGLTFRMGAEFGKDIKLRGGIYSDVLPINNYKDDKVRNFGLTGGFGVQIERVIVDLGGVMQMAFIEYDYDNETGPGSGGSMNEANVDMLLYTTLKYDLDFSLGR